MKIEPHPEWKDGVVVTEGERRATIWLSATKPEVWLVSCGTLTGLVVRSNYLDALVAATDYVMGTDADER